MYKKVIFNTLLKQSLKFILLFQFLFVSLMAEEPLNKLTHIMKENEKIKLQLQWKHQFEFAGFYAAKERGFYKEVGLDVELIEYDSQMNIVDEIFKGNAEYGLTYSSLISEYMSGKPLVFVANFFKQSPLVLVTQPHISSPADLKGKKIMGLLDGSHQQAILPMLDIFNIATKDFINIPRKFSIESFINKEVDAISVFKTNELYTLNQLGIQYNILDPAVFGRNFYDLNLFTTKSELENNPERVEHFRKASIRGWEYALEHKEELVEIIMQKYNTQHKSKEALLFEAKQIEALMLTNVYPIGSIDLERVEIIADTFAQSLSIPRESKENLVSFIYKTKENPIELTAQQQKYLQQKKVLKMCVDPNWMPLEKIEGEKHIGIAAEFMHLISEKMDTPIHLVKTNRWLDSIEKIKNRECDMLALAEKTPLREKYLNFTTPYIVPPLVVATKVGIPFVDNLNYIQEKRLGIVKNYSKEELLRSKYPNINLVEVESIQEGLAYVQQGKLFVFLDNSNVINYEIVKNSMKDISITGQFSEKFYLSVASRNDEPILNEILEKALLSIDNGTRALLMNKWNNIQYQLKADYRLVAQITVLSIILLSIFIYWNVKLKEEIKNKELAQRELKKSKSLLQEKAELLKVAKQQLEELNNSLEERVKDEIQKNIENQIMLMHQSKLAQMGEMIENIAHQWRQPLAQINSFILLIDATLAQSDFKNSTARDKLLEIESLTKYMSKTIDDFKNFFHPNKQKSLFQLRKAVEKSLDILKGTLREHHIKIELDIDEALECFNYLDELQQVILILLNNSIDALTTLQIKSPTITIAAKNDEDLFFISITDNALGIDSKIIDKIFEPYFTTKYKSQGTGLGLYMAKKIIDNGLKGKRSVQNRECGACFTIEIPEEKA